MHLDRKSHVMGSPRGQTRAGVPVDVIAQHTRCEYTMTDNNYTKAAEWRRPLNEISIAALRSKRQADTRIIVAPPKHKDAIGGSPMCLTGLEPAI